MRLTIKTKLTAVFAVVVALSGVSMFLALQSLGKLNDSLGTIVDVRAANALTMSDLETSLESVGSRLRAMIITSDEAVMQDYVVKIDQDMADIAAAYARLEGTIIDPQLREQLHQF